MWGYYDYEAMNTIEDTIWFETKEEVILFVKLATQRQMEEYPDEPETWSAFLEDCGAIIFETSPTTTAKQAVADWFEDSL